MTPFLSAGDAVRWALRVHEAWMFGRGLPVGPRLPPSTDGHQAHVTALSIIKIADSCDVVDHDGDSWIYFWYVRELGEQAWKRNERKQLREMRATFEDALATEGFIFPLTDATR